MEERDTTRKDSGEKREEGRGGRGLRGFWTVKVTGFELVRIETLTVHSVNERGSTHKNCFHNQHIFVSLAAVWASSMRAFVHACNPIPLSATLV